MSEMKRVELTTVRTSQNEKKVKKKANTYRFTLTLGESNQTTCPEYSFTDLIKSERPPSLDDPFGEGDEDGDVAAIAKRFEEKYGPKDVQMGKKKKTPDFDDYYDLGDGYDENDPFIDNSEAYDEVIPTSKRTKYGGFYINQGRLEVQFVDEDSVENFETPPVFKKKKKKRALDSDSEEETHVTINKKFKAMKRKKLLDSKEKEKKKKKKIANGEEKDVPVKKKKKKLMVDKLMLKKLPPPASLPPQKENSTSLVSTSSTGGVATESTPVETSSKTAAISNGIVEDNVESKGRDMLDSIEETFNAILQETMKEDSSSKSGEEGKGEQQSTDKNTQLPPQLPPELSEAIENIKKEAKENKEGKSKFFSADINKLLLDIELGSRNLVWGSRTAIYNHLGEHLPCGKHALQRRAKKLRESQHEDQLKAPIQKLREAILKVMPALKEQHELEVQKVKLEAEMKDEMSESVKEEASTESEGEEKSDCRKKPRAPRRKFHWDKEIKDLLLEIVSTKMKLYNACKSRNQTPEDYLKAFLETEIKPLWPQGWMQTRALLKESRSAHEDMTKGTVQQVKQKKAPTGTENVQSTLDSSRSHVSKTEDVIEVSSVIEDEDDRKDTVVVNLSNSDVKPMSTLLSATSVLDQSHSPITVLSTSTPVVNRLNKQTVRQITTSATGVSVLPSPISSALPPKASDISPSLSAKRVVPVPVIEVPDSPQKQTVTTKSFTSSLGISATSTPLSHGASMTSSHNSTSSSRSYLEAFDSFINKSLSKGDSPSTSSLQHQQQKLSGSSSQQQHSSQQLQQQQKVSMLSQKSGAHQSLSGLYQQQQHKLPQDQLRQSSLQQKAAVKQPPLVVTDIPNSSWTNVSSVVPVGKSTNPVVAVNRIPVNTLQKLSSGSHIPHSSLQQKQMLLQQTRQDSLSVPKSSQNIVTKKRQQPAGMDSISVTSVSNLSHQADKFGSSASIHLSSKQDFRSKSAYQHPQASSKANNTSNSQIKLGTVLGTSDPRHPHHQQHIKTGIYSSSGSSPVPSSRSAASFAGWTSQKNNRQPSPPRKSSSSLVSADQTSPSAMSGKTSGLFNSSFPSSLSRDSTPSPQKSPMSPGGSAALSLYEQVRSNIQIQEAMEGQALKNLAFALHYGGTGSGAGFPGRKSATDGLKGKTCRLPNTNNNSVCDDDIIVIDPSTTKQSCNSSQDSTRTNKNSQQSMAVKQTKKTHVQDFSTNLDSKPEKVGTGNGVSVKGPNDLKISRKIVYPSQVKYLSQQMSPLKTEMKTLAPESITAVCQGSNNSVSFERPAGQKMCSTSSQGMEDRDVKIQDSLLLDRRKVSLIQRKMDPGNYMQKNAKTATTMKCSDNSSETSAKFPLNSVSERSLLSSAKVVLNSQNIFDRMGQVLPGSDDTSFLKPLLIPGSLAESASKNVASGQTGRLLHSKNAQLSVPSLTPGESKLSCEALPHGTDCLSKTISQCASESQSNILAGVSKGKEFFYPKVEKQKHAGDGRDNSKS